MESFFPPELQIGEKIAKVPIIQGGMGVNISESGLASAVANEGGIGVLATAGIGFMEPDYIQKGAEVNQNALRNQVRKTREMTNGLIGVNIMVALSNFADMVETAVQEKLDFIFSGGGLPLHLPKYVDQHTEHPMLVPIVSSARAAKLLISTWQKKYDYIPDAFVVEGPLAGGHLGFSLEQINDPAFALEKLVPEVIEAVGNTRNRAGKIIPVIAAGGIYTGEDIDDIMHHYGASGVQMGTRFVATHECDASNTFKQAYIDAKQEDVRIIKSPVGLPGRAIDNEFLHKVDRGEKHPYRCPFHCITSCDLNNSPYCIALALLNAQRGNLNGGFAFAGANVYRVDKIISVHELVDTLLAEYSKAKENKHTRTKNK